MHDGTVINTLWGELAYQLGGPTGYGLVAEADRQGVQVSLISELARNYFELRGGQNELAVAQRNADNQRETLKITQARSDGGRLPIGIRTFPQGGPPQRHRAGVSDRGPIRGKFSSNVAGIPAIPDGVSAQRRCRRSGNASISGHRAIFRRHRQAYQISERSGDAVRIA